MAKDLPYFKFFCSEWNDGDITLEDMNIQGVFINVCSYYWSNECDLRMTKLRKRFKGFKTEIDTLLKEELIREDDGFVYVNFLDEQKDERLERSKVRSKGGKASAEARRLKKLEQDSNTSSTEKQHVLNSSSTQVQVLREEERRRELISFDKFWKYYDKKVNKPKSLSLFIKLTDKELDAMRIHLPKYLESTPDKQFRKSPDSYLRNKCWNDEIINRKQPKQMERL
jgi:hypothetical protein